MALLKSYRSRYKQLLSEARAHDGDKAANKKLILVGALIGQCAERDRTLGILRKHGLHEIAREITAISLNDVLKIEEPPAGS